MCVIPEKHVPSGAFVANRNCISTSAGVAIADELLALNALTTFAASAF